MSSWTEMDAQPRHPISELAKADLPDTPGVYAFYRDGQPVYVGKATRLRDRVWKRHCGRGKSMRSSAFRRNVAQHLGIASAADIYEAQYAPTEDDLMHVRGWIEGCEISWITTATESAAVALENALKAESMPPLTKL